MSLFEDVDTLKRMYHIRVHVSKKIKSPTLEFFLAIKGEEKRKKVYIESVYIYRI
jgi:hypothetical protein